MKILCFPFQNKLERKREEERQKNGEVGIKRERERDHSSKEILVTIYPNVYHVTTWDFLDLTNIFTVRKNYLNFLRLLKRL